MAASSAFTHDLLARTTRPAPKEARSNCRSSSMAEQSHCRRLVAGSSPACGSNNPVAKRTEGKASRDMDQIAGTGFGVGEAVHADALASSGSAGNSPPNSRDCAPQFGERQRKRRCKAANMTGSMPEAEWLSRASGLVRASRCRSPIKPVAGVASRLSDSFSTAFPPPRRRGPSAVSCLPARDCAFSFRNLWTSAFAARPIAVHVVPSRVCSSLSSMPQSSMRRLRCVSIVRGQRVDEFR